MNHFIVDGRYKDLLEYQGIDVSVVLKKAGLPENALNHKTPTMKEVEYYRFLEAIDEVADDPGMPVAMATTDKIETFSPPIFASYCSRNGAACIERLSRYKKLIGPMSFVVSKDEETETVELATGDPALKMPSFMVRSEFAFLIGMIRRATGTEMKPERITMRELPKGSEFEEFAGIALEKGGRDTITFTNAALEEPFVSHSEAMWSYFEPELNKRLADLEVDDSVSARVRSALTELLPAGVSGVESVAEKLGMSHRTLQRKLSEEGTTFQKQLNSTREVLALHYIKNTDMTTNDIAYLLGYAELNSFLRAFSIWTGKTITEYKKTEIDRKQTEETEGRYEENTVFDYDTGTAAVRRHSGCGFRRHAEESEGDHGGIHP